MSTLRIEVLDEEQIEKIKRLTEEMIENVGFRVEHGGLLKIAAKAGADVDETSQVVKVAAGASVNGASELYRTGNRREGI